MKHLKSLPNAKLKENDVAPEIAQAFAASGAHMFRNNIGVAKYFPKGGGKPFWVRYGVGGKGGSDHIGYLPVRVTQEMVGHYLAVFVAAEAKRPVGGVYDNKQIEFIDNAVAAGAIAGFVRSWEGARQLITDFHTRFRKTVADDVKKA